MISYSIIRCVSGISAAWWCSYKIWYPQLDWIDLSAIAFVHRKPMPLLLVSWVARQLRLAAAEVSHF